MSCSRIFQNFKTEILKKYAESFEYNNEDSLFLAIGRPIPWSRDPLGETINYTDSIGSTGTTSITQFYGSDELQSIPTPLDSDRERSGFLRNNIYMKKISSSDFCFLIPRYEWTSGTVYDSYRDEEELFSPRRLFYVYNKANRGVYKCLDNNNSSPSTQAPSQVTTESFSTSDGYTWKLIYRITVNDEIFSSVGGVNGQDEYVLTRYVDYKPFSDEEIQQQLIQDSATYGSVEFVEINPSFRGRITYDKIRCVIGNDSCYVYEDASIGATSIKINLCGNLSNHPTTNGFLNDLVFNVFSGSGYGQRRIITNSQLTSVLDGSGITCNQYITISFTNPLNLSLNETSRFNIEPRIRVVGDGSSKSATAFYISSPNSAEFEPVFEKYRESDLTETLNYVKVVDGGKNYSYMKAFFSSGITNYYEDLSGTVKNTSMENFNKEYLNFLNPILSPLGGHGSNPIKEFGSSEILFKNILVGDEEGRLTPFNDFRQVSLIKNPLFNKPITQLRFGVSKPSGLSAGSVVVDGGNRGTVIRLHEFSNPSSFEVLVSGISGTFKNSSQVSFDGGSPIGISNGSFNDGYKEFTVVGTEAKNLLVLRVSNWDSSTNTRMVVFGSGNSSTKIYPSLASGMIRKIEQVNSTTYDIYLENYRGRFSIGEKLTISNGSSVSVTNMTVTSFYYEKEDIRNSYSVTTKVYLTPQTNRDLNNVSFVEDQPIYSYDSNSYSKNQLSTKIVGSGHLFKYTFVDSKNGILELIGARSNTFRKGDYIPYYFRGQLSFALINNVLDSEVNYNSGEVLYIQNFGPIQRNSSSREEINLVLGI